MLMIRQLNAKGSFLKEEDFYKYLLSKTHRQHFSIHDISESKITINYAHRFSPIPKKYLMSHLTDLILKAIQDLDHLLFLPLGTAHHAIICVIEKKDETYTYRIFNTGKGFKKGGHLYRFENKKLFIKPITIENLNIKAFSYTFIFDLVQAIIDNQLTLEDWYQLHHSALIDKAGGQWITEQGPEYLGQKADTCTYRSIEASAFFYLSSTVQQKLNQAKLEVSQNKYHTYIFNQNEPTITNQELLKVLIDKQKKN
jgi:hypothetical protein